MDSDGIVRLTESARPGRRISDSTDLVIVEAIDVGEGVTNLREAPDSGWRWAVTMIRPGVSKNRRRYRPEVLKEAAPLYEGARAFDGHRTDDERVASGTANMVGFHENVTVGPDGELRSEFTILRSAPHVRELFVSAWESERPNLVGFSHDVNGSTKEAIDAGRKVADVMKIHQVNSVDVVADPSAGGRMERLVAGGDDQDQGEQMNPLERFRQYLADNPKLDKRAALRQFVDENDDLTMADMVDLMGELDQKPVPAQGGASNEDEPETAEKGEKKPVAVGGGATPEGGESSESDGETAPQATEAVKPKPGSLLHKMLIREAIAQAKLPAALGDQLAVQLADFHGTEAEIVAQVQGTKRMFESVSATIPSNLPGQGGAIGTGQDELEKMQKSLDGLIAGKDVDGVPRFKSLKEAYSRWTGRHPYNTGDEDFARWILAESVGGVPSAGARLTEAVLSTTWTQALGDSITRQAIAEYNFAPLSTWRRVVSETPNIPDFRTNRRFRLGGFDTLAAVNEDAAYPALTSMTDEEATYAVGKYGGTEYYTLEAAANDDVQALQRIPRNMGRAAALTLYRAIWVTEIEGNALTSYDATALYDATHGNTSAVALSADAIQTARVAMLTQARLGEASGFIGIQPSLLVVPPELEQLAYEITNSAVKVNSTEDATIPNRQGDLMYLTVPLFTDANDWYLFANPGDVPIFEVGFYQGREDPEIFVQDQPSVGSVFTNDRITWKVRHIWGLAALDHRGTYRGTQA